MANLKCDPKTDKYSCDYKHKEPDDHCDTCEADTCFHGRYLPAVNEYASTCDGCGELTSHCEMTMDIKTQLGYCKICCEQKIENAT